MKNKICAVELLFNKYNVWKKMESVYWAALIAENPSYVKQNDTKFMSASLDFLFDYEAKKRKNPNLKLPEDDFVKLSSREWMVILSKQPTLEWFADKYQAWEILDDYTMSYIVFNQDYFRKRATNFNLFEVKEYKPAKKTNTEVRFENARKIEIEKRRKIISVLDFYNPKIKFDTLTPLDWITAFEIKDNAIEVCTKNSIYNLSTDKPTGWYAFDRFNWREAILTDFNIVNVAKKYNAFNLLLGEDYCAMLKCNFDKYYPIIEDINGWEKFFTSDWFSLLIYLLKNQNLNK